MEDSFIYFGTPRNTRANRDLDMSFIPVPRLGFYVTTAKDDEEAKRKIIDYVRNEHSPPYPISEASSWVVLNLIKRIPVKEVSLEKQLEIIRMVDPLFKII